MDSPFDYKTPTPEQLEAIKGLREAAKAHEAAILRYCHNNRQRSIAMTTLEQVSMWANKSVTHG
jgi:hypothetical protein